MHFKPVPTHFKPVPKGKSSKTDESERAEKYKRFMLKEDEKLYKEIEQIVKQKMDPERYADEANAGDAPADGESPAEA